MLNKPDFLFACSCRNRIGPILHMRQGDVEQARARVERERVRSSMLASVSHDLRTPLASIVGTLSSLRSFGARYDDRTRIELLATAQGEAERLDRFVGNLLDMTRLDAGAVEPKREVVEIGDLISTALRRASPLLKGHRVASAIASDLPSVTVDFVLAEQVPLHITLRHPFEINSKSAVGRLRARVPAISASKLSNPVSFRSSSML